MAKKNTIFVTKEGLKALQDEYKYLVEVCRASVAKKIRDAAALGDLSENNEYTVAKDEKAEIEGRIVELEDILKRAQVSKQDNSSIIDVGSKVKVKIGGTEAEFHIVGAPEADPSKQKISHESPLGEALLGKGLGDNVEITTPGGKAVYTIVSIS